MNCLQSLEYLVALGKAIGRAIDKGMQNGLEAGIDRGRLESQKDASIADIMSLLHLEGPATETPKASQLQPSYEQLMLPIHRTGDNRIRGDVASRSLSLSNAMVPLIEPLSAKNLVGDASTSDVPTTAALTTDLSITFAPTSSVPSILVLDYEVLDAEPQTEAPPSASVVFEKEELDTTP
ncbi:hypothetical protein Tco_0021940 [Tanacetum coccineum]